MADIHPTVLVIDDEPQIRRFLRATLEANGYQLVEAVGLWSTVWRHAGVMCLQSALAVPILETGA